MTALGTGLRQLSEQDRGDIDAVLAADPVAGCAVASRLESRPVSAVGGALWGVGGPGALRALVYAGGTVIPLSGADADLRLIAGELARRPRRCASVVGRAEAVLAMWPLLQESWGPARDVRPEQPLMVTTAAGETDFDPAVHRVEAHQLDDYVPAALAMFTEELGVRAPLDADGSAYRRRVKDLIAAGLAFARVDADGHVIFKAEIAAVSRRCCQVQGVWVDPRWRGRGIGAAGTAAVIRFGLQLAPAVSLYVNSFNHNARSMYRRVGMREVATFATVLY